jgi:hypothetical protein
VAIDSLKFRPPLPYLTDLYPMGGPPLKQPYAQFRGGHPAGKAACGGLPPLWTGHPYAYGKDSRPHRAPAATISSNTFLLILGFRPVPVPVPCRCRCRCQCQCQSRCRCRCRCRCQYQCRCRCRAGAGVGAGASGRCNSL